MSHNQAVVGARSPTSDTEQKAPILLGQTDAQGRLQSWSWSSPMTGPRRKPCPRAPKTSSAPGCSASRSTRSRTPAHVSSLMGTR